MTSVIAPPRQHRAPAWTGALAAPSANALVAVPLAARALLAPDASRIACPPVPRIASITPADRDAIGALFARCSAQTRRLRFFGNVTELPPDYLAGALAAVPARHDALGAWQAGELVGLASVVATGDSIGELAILVDDTHQRQRLGTAMAGELARRARARGVTRLTASVLPGRTALLEWLARHYRMQDITFGEDEVSAVYRIGPGSEQRWNVRQRTGVADEC
jgi:GNAT superfamily N-acetyltransferase